MGKYAVDVPPSLALQLDIDLGKEDTLPSTAEDVPQQDFGSLLEGTKSPIGASFAEPTIDYPTDARHSVVILDPWAPQPQPEFSIAATLRPLPSPTAAAAGRAPRLRDVRVFCNFLNAPGKKATSFNVRLRDPCKGRDVVEATIKVFFGDERFRAKFSDHPDHYSLHLASETGEIEDAISQQQNCSSFNCMAVVPTPAAHFSASHGLLPYTEDDVSMSVELIDGETRVARNVLFPADLLVAGMDKHVQKMLNIRGFVEGSLKVKFGSSEILLTESYNFGLGCGNCQIPVANRTVLSLKRFGVTEITCGGVLSSEDMEVVAPAQLGPGPSVGMDEEEARAYRQWDVIKINKFGVRQERVIGIDGERIYNMRRSKDSGSTKNPERNIVDIEAIKSFPDRANYFEVEYKRPARYDTDKIECRTATDCSLMLEKLRVLKKLNERKKERMRSDTTLGTFFRKIGFGK